MKVIEVLKLNSGILNICKSLGIKVDDVQYIALYNDYIHLRDDGEKVSYIVAVLSERYGCSERKVYDVVKRMQMDCDITAVC